MSYTKRKVINFIWPFLPHLHVGRYPHNCFCTLTPTLSLTLLTAHATSSQTFSRTISYPSSFYSHRPAYEDGTECSKTSAYKLQTPRNYPKESIQLYSCTYKYALHMYTSIYWPTNAHNKKKG